MTLTSDQIEQFVEQGFVRIEEAFPRNMADEAREILWRETGCDPHDPATWTKPVIRVGEVFDPAFAEAANTGRLHDAFDALGGGRGVGCRANA